MTRERTVFIQYARSQEVDARCRRFGVKLDATQLREARQIAVELRFDRP